MVGGYIWSSQDGSEDLTVGNMTEEWAIVGLPLLVSAAILLAVAFSPRSWESEFRLWSGRATTREWLVLIAIGAGTTSLVAEGIERGSLLLIGGGLLLVVPAYLILRRYARHLR